MTTTTEDKQAMRDLFPVEDREMNAVCVMALVYRNLGRDAVRVTSETHRAWIIRNSNGGWVDFITDDGRGATDGVGASLYCRWPQFSWNTAKLWSELMGEDLSVAYPLMIHVSATEMKRLAALPIDPSNSNLAHLDRADRRDERTQREQAAQ